jgi:hypothetical protein
MNFDILLHFFTALLSVLIKVLDKVQGKGPLAIMWG